MDKVKIEVSGDARELVLREGHAPEIFVFSGRKFVAGSHKSFVELVKSKASKSNAVVAYNESGAKCIIDDTVVNMPFETILYAYQPSIQAKEWGKILSNDGKVFEHKQIIDFLKIRTDDEIPIIEALLNGLLKKKMVQESLCTRLRLSRLVKMLTRRPNKSVKLIPIPAS